jgi:hypothetical protein
MSRLTKTIALAWVKKALRLNLELSQRHSQERRRQAGHGRHLDSALKP